ncbi:methyl-accepting chemotaxis protein [Paenibacillus soyae]|uniref:Methyl-accepting chemotaxis protein n=1 Tax=Paenibacillus soyae TaxID=2969249 RepID=A0A9X2MXC3_9BACL|nr:methyl-accepting chemotaxis protein [Paenibacillus soyae]MCR2805257.1 methyl-accepting chemotaxis protein [Paenibacillus soyae]
MFKWWKNRSLVLTSSVILAFLLVALISVMQWMSYKAQYKDFEEEIVMIGHTLGYQVEFEFGITERAAEELINQKTSLSEPFTILRQKFDAMTRNDNIANAYIYLPEKSSANGSEVITMLQGNAELEEVGFGPGATYAMGETIAETFETALKSGEGWSPVYSDEIGSWLTYFKRIEDPQGNVVGVFGLDFDVDHLESEIQSMIKDSIILAVILIAAAVLVIVVLVTLVLRPLRQLSGVAKLAADGDLTVAVPVHSGNEIGQVSRSFNEMIASLRQLTGEIRNSTTEVAESAENMQQSAEQTSRATEEVTEAIQEVASGTETQLQSFQECQRAMTEMTIGISRIAESSSSVSEMAADTTSLATQGGIVIEQTRRQMQEVEEQISQTVVTMRELHAQSEQIVQILGMISEVANQTNLLALNASIEAARAGEHGKGFAVVAVEIRKLAERSKESSEQISAILGTIGSHTKEAASAMEQSVTAARHGSAVSIQAGESFQAIVHSIQQVSDQVQEVSAAAQQMSASSEQVTASLDQLEHISSTSAGNAQRVAAASEEQLASMQEVASSSEQLRHLASSLNEAVGRFRT